MIGDFETWKRGPFTALLVVLLLLVSPGYSRPTETTSADPAPTPSTIIDVLSADIEYSYFLRTLQRHGMVPIINSLGNVTLLAPVNLAFAENEAEQFDSNTLLRYIINQKVRVGYMGRKEMLFETLSQTPAGNYTITISPDFELQEYVVDKLAAIVEPDVYAKHQQSFIQGIDKFLPERPSACEILMGDYLVDGHSITFVQQLFQILFREDAVEFADKKRKKKKKKKKHPKYPAIPQTCSEFLNKTKTMFIPSDSYVDSSLSRLERRYYLALYHDFMNPDFDTTKDAIKEMKRDVASLLSNLLIPEYILGANGTGNPYKAPSGAIYNTSLATNSSRLLLNGQVIEATSAMASDKVLHIFDDQKHKFFDSLGISLAPMIPRKALYALHLSHFAQELELHNLASLIDGSSSNQTIFIDIDQRDDNSEDLKESTYGAYSTSAKQSLQYQFVEGAQEFNGYLRRLLDSKFCSKKKMGSCYKVKVASSNSSTAINDDVNITKEPIRCANDTHIYFADDDIDAPINFKRTLGQMISKVDNKDDLWHLDAASCFKTIEILKQFKLLSLADNAKGYTVFLPISNSKAGASTRTHWDRLGLVLQYLNHNEKEFKNVVKNLIVEGLIYSDFHGENATFKTLQGEELTISHKNLKAYSNGISLNDTQLELPLAGDILFNQGVIQAIDQVLLPQSLEISSRDLIEATFEAAHKAHYMLDLLEGFPKVSSMVLGPEPNHSLLIPTPLSLKDFNVTVSFPKLLEFLEMHLIPNSELPKLLACVDGGSVFSERSVTAQGGLLSTNHSDVMLSCRHNHKTETTFLKFHEKDKFYEKDKLAFLSYDKGHEVKVVSHGCSLGNGKAQTCVFLINKPLNLDWLDHSRHDNFLHIHLGFVSVGVGIILGLILFGAVFLLLVLCLEKPRKGRLVDAPTAPFEDEHESDFMGVRSSEEESIPWDRGYETDYDIASETESLLPYKKKGKHRDYKAGGSTAPVSIRTQDITKHLNRERNLPGNY